MLKHMTKKLQMFSFICSQLSLVMYTLLSPDPAVQSLLKPSQQPQRAAALNALLTGITSTETPLYVAVGLLDLLVAVNSQVSTDLLFREGTRYTKLLAVCRKVSPCSNLIFVA